MFNLRSVFLKALIKVGCIYELKNYCRLASASTSASVNFKFLQFLFVFEYELVLMFLEILLVWIPKLYCGLATHIIYIHISAYVGIYIYERGTENHPRRSIRNCFICCFVQHFHCTIAIAYMCVSKFLSTFAWKILHLCSQALYCAHIERINICILGCS